MTKFTNKQLLDCVNTVTATLAVSGLLVTVLGTSVFILGTISNAGIKLGETLKAHESTIDSLVACGGNAGLVGLCGVGVASVFGIARNNLTPEEIVQVDEEKRCQLCIYYLNNSYLPCAVHPDLPKNCKDYANSQNCK